MNMQDRYYLYRHIREDKNEVFYIGIGTKYLKYPNNYYKIYCRAYTKSYRNIHWKRIVAKTKYTVEIMIECGSYDQIKIKEIEFIALYGRRDQKAGTLVNMSDGGQGTKRRPFSKETLEKMRQKKIGKKLGPEHLKNLREARKRQVWNPRIGKNNPRSRPVNKKTLSGEIIGAFDSISLASRMTGESKSAILGCLKGRLKQNNGFIWEYQSSIKRL